MRNSGKMNSSPLQSIIFIAIDTTQSANAIKD
jgi:hypothetical protein